MENITERALIQRINRKLKHWNRRLSKARAGTKRMSDYHLVDNIYDKSRKTLGWWHVDIDFSQVKDQRALDEVVTALILTGAPAGEGHVHYPSWPANAA
jgi:hypothetical protein